MALRDYSKNSGKFIVSRLVVGKLFYCDTKQVLDTNFATLAKATVGDKHLLTIWKHANAREQSIVIACSVISLKILLPCRGTDSWGPHQIRPWDDCDYVSATINAFVELLVPTFILLELFIFIFSRAFLREIMNCLL